ncbi:MAG: T9SS type A sorting domain-containing protein [Bacteroidetes bacterium]|nr:T9SS type A sorting domain-containing protein [Bacteroidota bacterium]
MEESAFEDRGTGYNYFDGTTWQPWPEERIENQRTGWPSYAPFGANGELIAAHYSGTSSGVMGLAFSRRLNKGTGDWDFFDFHSPEPEAEYLWPRMITSGIDHSVIHVLALTMPVGNGGIIYHGLNGALLYSRSIDGGQTWDIQNQILPGMDSTEYSGFTTEAYAFAEPKENIIAFVTGSHQHDLFLMKSTDNGETFEKTIIWDNPYDLMTPTFQTEPFFSVDCSVAVSLDNTGMAHVVFGIVKAWYDLADESWMFDIFTDGVGYWNETMEPFSSNPNALDPSCGPESELVQNETLIGWSPDLNGNGTWDILGEWAPYPCVNFALGVSSMVQLIADSQNRLFLVYSSVTETYNNAQQDYRRLWLRSSLDGGQTWGQFYHYFSDSPIQQFIEYVFPSCASFSDENLYLIYQGDIEPGIHCQGSMGWSQNFFQFAAIPKDEIVGIKPVIIKTGFTVSQNFPNPFSETTVVNVTLNEPAGISLDILNLLGQKVSESKKMTGKAGINTMTIESKGLPAGVYFYKVETEQATVMQKMIIE